MSANKKFLVLFCITIVTVALMLVVSSFISRERVIYTSGTVIDPRAKPGTIEVRLEDNGPRVYVDDFENCKCSNIEYGDTVKLKFQNRNFWVIEIIKEDSDE